MNIVEAQQPGINGSRMLDLEKGSHITGAPVKPNDVHLLQDALDRIKSTWKLCPTLETLAETPIQSNAVFRRNPDIIALGFSDYSKHRLHLAMCQVRDVLQLGRIEQTIDDLVTKIPLYVKAPCLRKHDLGAFGLRVDHCF